MNGDQWLEFAEGPLFAAAFLVMLLGLARHVFLQMHLLATKGRTLHRVYWRRIVADSLSWAFPVRHLMRGTIVLTFSSILFHGGAILVPLFLADHVVLWEDFFRVPLPSLDPGIADYLTVLTIASLVVLLAYRLLIPRSHALSKPGDYVILIMVLLPFLSGCLAAHPSVNPLPWQFMMLIHVLSAEALFVIVPFTKLAHIVLFPFDRLSQVHWQLRPGAGEQVATALYGDEARV
jgi:nitrate reductase gamma subunit